MRLSPATRLVTDPETHPLLRVPRPPNIIKEQRFLPAPADAPPVQKFYPIDNVMSAAKYLVRVEDRMLPVAFFAEPRYGFRTIIGFYNQLRTWKQEGYNYVLMVHGADPTVSVNQPFGRYYIWENRLKTLRYLEPIMR